MRCEKESKWQSADNKPKISGVYKIKGLWTIDWCYWHNRRKCWDIACSSKAEAMNDFKSSFCSWMQDWEWKGILEEPSSKEKVKRK